MVVQIRTGFLILFICQGIYNLINGSVVATKNLQIRKTQVKQYPSHKR